jgi:hypothetical protein
LTCRTAEAGWLMRRSRGRLANRTMQVSRWITALAGFRKPDAAGEGEFDVEPSPQVGWEQ